MPMDQKQSGPPQLEGNARNVLAVIISFTAAAVFGVSRGADDQAYRLGAALGVGLGVFFLIVAIMTRHSSWIKSGRLTQGTGFGTSGIVVALAMTVGRQVPGNAAVIGLTALGGFFVAIAIAWPLIKTPDE